MGVIQVKRINKNIQLPEYATAGSVGMDVFAREDVVILPGQAKAVALNVILVDYPVGYAPFLFPRSSLFTKKGLIQGNSVGVIDLDYRGAHDEVKIILYNTIGVPAQIKAGEKVAQIVFLPAMLTGEDTTIVEVAKAADKSRLGFGSTGGYAD